MGKGILTVNVGSSSLKLNLFADSEENCIAQVSISSIALPQSRIAVRIDETLDETTKLIANHTDAITLAIESLASTIETIGLSAIAIRIVHGGDKYHTPTLIDNVVLSELRRLIALDPDHIPTTLESIEVLSRLMPHVTLVACFDTGFFHDIPLVASTIPLPREYREKGLRRYGFHGLSYEYVLGEFRHIAGDVAANGRVIIAHLGSGASLAAIKNSQPVDMTMGFSPTSGVPMSTRSGDIDPSVITYLAQVGVSVDEYNDIINTQSGLLGVSGISGDMLTLIQQEDESPEAHEAIELFCYSVRKSIGALSAVLGGIDSLIFTGGIGEPSSIIRSRVCNGLEYLGIKLDLDHNNIHSERISSDISSVGVHVIPTNESRILYRGAISVVINNNGGEE